MIQIIKCQTEFKYFFSYIQEILIETSLKYRENIDYWEN